MEKRPTDKYIQSTVDQIEADQSFDCNDSIMVCVESGRAKMKARWFVLTEELGLSTTWVLLILMLIAIINIDLFILSQGPQWEFMAFGTSGWAVVAQSFPYGWVGFGLILMVFAIYLMKQFAWSYLYPFKVFVVLMVVGVFTVGGITFATGVNDTMYMRLIEEPGAGNSFLAKVYCVLGNRELNSSHALRGEVMYVDSSNLVIQTPNLDVYSVNITSDTKFLDIEEIKQFDYIKLIGDHLDEYFVASMVKIHEHPNESMPLTREGADCLDKQEWQHKIEVAEYRRQIANQPMSPLQGTAELMKSIY